MQLNEAKLPEIDIYSEAFIDLHAVTSEVRKQSWIAKYNHGYMMLDLESMRYFLQSDFCRTSNRDMTKLMGIADDSSFARFNNHFMQALAGDEHAKMRGAVNKAFTPKAANEQRTLMKKTIHEVIDQYGSSGQCDFADFSRHYPITVMCRMLGVDENSIPKFETWLDTMANVTAPTPEVISAVDDALANMFSYADQLVEERRQPEHRKGDLLQSLVDLGTAGEDISEEDMRILIIHLLAGGFDTVKKQFILLIKNLCDSPEVLETISKDRSKIKPFIEESLRYKNPIGIINRVTNTDIEYRGFTIPKDTMLMLPLTVAGRDEAANDSPETFDIDRETKTHLAWGQGIHMCLAMFLAKAIMEEGLNAVLDRMKNIRPAGEAAFRFQGASWGCSSLPVTFDPV